MMALTAFIDDSINTKSFIAQRNGLFPLVLLNSSTVGLNWILQADRGDICARLEINDCRNSSVLILNRCEKLGALRWYCRLTQHDVIQWLMGASRRARHIPFPAHTSSNRAMTNPFILLYCVLLLSLILRYLMLCYPLR